MPPRDSPSSPRSTDDQITDFFDRFAAALADDDTFAPIADANAADVAAAAARGSLDHPVGARRPDAHPTWSPACRDGETRASRRDGTVDRVDHDAWSVEARRAPLGVVGFVFEGRPNVFADACGVVRTGNTVVFRIGSDALGTARAIVDHALDTGAARSRAARGHGSTRRFADTRCRARAVRRPTTGARRGAGVGRRGRRARRSRIAVRDAREPARHRWRVDGGRRRRRRRQRCAGGRTFARPQGVQHPQRGGAAPRTGRRTGRGRARRTRRCGSRLGGPAHVCTSCRAANRTCRRTIRSDASRSLVPAGSATSPQHRRSTATGWRSSGSGSSHRRSPWSSSTRSTRRSTLCNRYSPRFVASIVTDDPDEYEGFYAAVDAPFVGNGFTRWVDGQYALNAPELGLSNWQFGRMLGRGAILSGDSVHTVRYRAAVTDHSFTADDRVERPSRPGRSAPDAGDVDEHVGQRAGGHAHGPASPSFTFTPLAIGRAAAGEVEVRHVGAVAAGHGGQEAWRSGSGCDDVE